MTDLAATWRQAMQRARTLNPERIAAYIVEGADIGLRASRYDAQGGRTTRVACDDPEHCDDGPQDHSHLVVSDPTGNAATRGRGRDSSTDDLRRLNLAAKDMVRFAGVVLHWVSGDRPISWSGVVLADAKAMQQAMDRAWKRLRQTLIADPSPIVVQMRGMSDQATGDRVLAEAKAAPIVPSWQWDACVEDIRAKLPPQVKHRRTTPPLRNQSGPSLRERAQAREKQNRERR